MHIASASRGAPSSSRAQARFRTGSVQITGESRQYIRIGDEGGKTTFSFCPICGATVHYQGEGHEDSIAIPVGAFAEPGFPPPVLSVYEERKHSWVAMPQHIEHMA